MFLEQITEATKTSSEGKEDDTFSKDHILLNDTPLLGSLMLKTAIVFPVLKLTTSVL
jgi:hypothetical protein